jgi:hypothetical protein
MRRTGVNLSLLVLAFLVLIAGRSLIRNRRAQPARIEADVKVAPETVDPSGPVILRPTESWEGDSVSPAKRIEPPSAQVPIPFTWQPDS